MTQGYIEALLRKRRHDVNSERRESLRIRAAERRILNEGGHAKASKESVLRYDEASGMMLHSVHWNGFLEKGRK